MKVWFVTGTSRGLGLEIARQALNRGDAVVATARRPAAAADALGGPHDRLLVQQLDVTAESDARAAAAAAVDRFGRIDVLVNNAGRGLFGAVEETTIGDARRLFETNVFGVLAVIRAVLPVMRRQRSGHVIMMSSMGGFSSGAGFGVYAATKFGVEALAEALVEELEPFGIAVTVVEPGVLETEFAVSSSELASEPLADYAAPEQTVEQYDDGEDGGDPAAAAAAIVGLTDLAEPPFRLPLGADAVERIRAKAVAVLDGLERRPRDVFDEMTAVQRR